MEVATHTKQGGSFMKSKLMMSFYRPSKPSSTMQYQYENNTSSTNVKTVKTVSLTTRSSTGGDDGYVHGPNGGAGDVHVDSKATSYIFHVKERLRLEEVNLAKSNNGDKCL